MKKLALVSALFAGTVSALAESNELVIQSFRVVSEGNGISAIIGTATDRTGRTFSAAFIEFDLYDSGGTVVGNTIDHVAFGAGQQLELQSGDADAICNGQDKQNPGVSSRSVGRHQLWQQAP